MATHIMPCPVTSLSIAVYAGYKKKNKLLLALLTVWGLTGVKSVVFNAYEDIILLACGLYGMVSETTDYAKEKAKEYGIEIIDTQIRALNYPESNKQSVYERMKTEREQMARKYRSEGSEEAAKIRADAEKEQTVILAEAYKQAQEIKGQGDAEAIKIYGEAFQKDPKFYEFIRTLETYEKTIDNNTTLILPSTAEILKYLSGNSIGSGSGTGAAIGE